VICEKLLICSLESQAKEAIKLLGCGACFDPQLRGPHGFLDLVPAADSKGSEDEPHFSLHRVDRERVLTRDLFVSQAFSDLEQPYFRDRRQPSTAAYVP